MTKKTLITVAENRMHWGTKRINRRKCISLRQHILYFIHQSNL